MKKLDLILIVSIAGFVANEVFTSLSRKKSFKHASGPELTKAPPLNLPSSTPKIIERKTIENQTTIIDTIQVGSIVTCRYSITNTETGELLADSTMKEMPTTFSVTDGVVFSAIETVLIGKGKDFNQKININSNQLKDGELSSQLMSAFSIPPDTNITIDITVLSIASP